MTFDDDIFGHLDDPTPPRYGSDVLASVTARGHAIRQRRRMAYTISSAAAMVVIAGSAIAVAASDHGSPSINGANITNTTTTPKPHMSPSAHNGDGKKGRQGHHTTPPSSGSSAGTQPPGTTGGGSPGPGHHHTKVSIGPSSTTTTSPTACVTITPTITPSPDPSDTSTAPPPGRPGQPTCEPTTGGSATGS